MRLIQNYWKFIVAGLLTPGLIFFIKEKAIAKPITRNLPDTNLNAFLLTIQFAEGTYGNNAYQTLYGGGLFYDYNWHPNLPVTRWGITSTAAGAYQILYSTWLNIAQSAGLTDFSPNSQDKAAMELIKRRGALEDVTSGRFGIALYKCRKEWASLPGAGYGQKEQSLARLIGFYQKAGGRIIN